MSNQTEIEDLGLHTESFDLPIYREKGWKEAVEWVPPGETWEGEKYGGAIVVNGRYSESGQWRQGNLKLWLKGIALADDGSCLVGECQFPDQWKFNWKDTVQELMQALQKAAKAGNVREVLDDKRMNAWRPGF